MTSNHRAIGLALIGLALITSALFFSILATSHREAQAPGGMRLVLEVTPSKGAVHVLCYPNKDAKRARYTYYYEAEGETHQYTGALAGRCPALLLL